MKKYIIVLGLIAVLGGTFAFTAHAAPNPIDYSGIIAKVVSKFELAIANINDRLQAQVIHVTLADTDCITNRTTSIAIGWCPDGTNSDFNIIDKNLKVGDSVITAQATNPETPSIVKMGDCRFAAVTGIDTATPVIRLSCTAAPLDGAILNYVIVNH